MRLVWRRAGALALLLLCLLSHVHANPWHEADALFSYGEEPRRDRQALTQLERLLAAAPPTYQLVWRAARAVYYVGDAAGDADKAALFTRGIAWAKQAVALEPHSVEGHFWLGANYGGLSEVKGALQALSMVQQVRQAMETVIRLQGSYEHGNAYRALGEMARQLPGVFGGSLKRAVTYLEQGVLIAPDNLQLKLSLAKAYREAGQREASQRQLLDILQRPVRSVHAKADQHTQTQAGKLLYQ